jgi:hypothetical protein
MVLKNCDYTLLKLICCRLWTCKNSTIYNKNTIELLNMNMCAIDHTMKEREIAPIFETNHHLGQFFHCDHWIWILNTTLIA